MPAPLLVVTVDHLPAWILPAYGATWVAMPATSRLAARGVVFDGLTATSDDPHDTATALVSWLTDRPPHEVAVVTDDAALAARLPAGVATVVQAVARAATADDASATNLGRLFAAATAVVAAGRRVVWCHASGLGVSWDAPDELRDAYLDPDDPPPPPGAAVPDMAVTPATDPDVVTGLRHVFAAQLTLLDRCLGPLVEAIGPSATVLLAGLRGMPLGLHGRLGPGASPPFGELVQLPAILVDAAGRMAGQRYGGLVTPADLGATLAALHDGEPATTGTAAASDPVRGRSLGSLFEAWHTEVRDRVITVASRGVAVTTDGWRLVLPSDPGDGSGRARLFARPDDYLERCDVADRSPAVCEELTAVAIAVGHRRVAEAWAMPLSAATGRSS